MNNVYIGAPNTSGGSLGISHLVFRETCLYFFWIRQTALGSLGTSHLAPQEKGVISWTFPRTSHQKIAGGSLGQDG